MLLLLFFLSLACCLGHVLDFLFFFDVIVAVVLEVVVHYYFGVVWLFGVLIICLCHYLVLYIFDHLFGQHYIWCYTYDQFFWCSSWCFIIMHYCFGLLQFLAKSYLVVDHIADILMTVTFLVGTIAISPLLYHPK